MYEFDFVNGKAIGDRWYPALRPIEKALVKVWKEHKRWVYVQYEPGNATRYDVLFFVDPFGEISMTVVNHRACMIVAGPMHTVSQLDYMKEKMSLPDGDLYALMPLINWALEELL